MLAIGMLKASLQESNKVLLRFSSQFFATYLIRIGNTIVQKPVRPLYVISARQATPFWFVTKKLTCGVE